MNRIARTLVIALTFSVLTTTDVQAADQYITDIVYVPMRAGPGNQFKILHQGLRTGTRLTVLEDNAGDGFSKVALADGTEGFIRTQYLMNQPPARTRLPKEQEKSSELTAQLDKLRKQLNQKETELRTLKGQLKNTSTQLDEKTTELVSLREATAEPRALDRRNKQLMEENQQYKNRVEVVEAENAQLIHSDSMRWYLYGSGTIVVGVLLGLLLPMVRFRKKPSSDWV